MLLRDAIELQKNHFSPVKPIKLSGETFSTLINLSGRRRFTSQRLVLYAVLAVHSDRSATAVAWDALKLFIDAHEALVGNDQLPGVFCEELEAAYFGSDQGDKQIRDFIAHAQRALEAIDNGYSNAVTLVDQLVSLATPLLLLLNRITQVYEELAKRNAKQMKKQLAGIMTDIESIAKQARMVAFNAQIVAARAGQSGREFSVVAGVLSEITKEIDGLVQEAMRDSIGMA